MRESHKKNIVWIASYPKSGNTWFRLFLSSVLNPDKDSIDINNFDSTTIASSRSIFDKISGTNSSDLTLEEINLIRPQIYKTISAESQNVLYIKVHDAWLKNIDNAEVFPREITKSVILVVRNPFDLAVSFSNHSGISIGNAIKQINNIDQTLAGDQRKLSSQLCQRISNWSEHFKSWVDHSGLNVHVIRYEDMLSEPTPAFAEAIDFLGIKTSLSQIKSSIKMCSFEELQNQEKQFGFKEKPIKSGMFFNMGKRGYWKDFLDEEGIRSLKNKHAEILERLSY